MFRLFDLRLCLSLCICLSLNVFSSELACAQDSDQRLFEDHLQSLRMGMSILGAWSVSNLLVGGMMRLKTSSTAHYFHEMNATWNLVNLGIASFAYFSLPEVSGWSALEGLRELEKTDRILLFNAGLDLAYIAFGYALIERGQRLHSERSLGYGRSLILQGAFLFLFDSAFAYLHSDLTDQVRVLISPTVSGLSLSLSF